jgi:hypothetical protein
LPSAKANKFGPAYYFYPKKLGRVNLEAMPGNGFFQRARLDRGQGRWNLMGNYHTPRRQDRQGKLGPSRYLNLDEPYYTLSPRWREERAGVRGAVKNVTRSNEITHLVFAES